jgi:hypothetical protein
MQKHANPVFKLVPAWLVGKRTLRDARKLIFRLKSATDRHIAFFTSDELPHYAYALLDGDGELQQPPRRGFTRTAPGTAQISALGFVLCRRGQRTRPRSDLTVRVYTVRRALSSRVDHTSPDEAIRSGIAVLGSGLDIKYPCPN